MPKDHREIADDVSAGASGLRKAHPEVLAAFGELGAAAYKDGALSPRIKELMALAIAITVRCDGCVAFHARAAARRGATRDEVVETVGVAIHMGGGPSFVYGTEALGAYDAFARESEPSA